MDCRSIVLVALVAVAQAKKAVVEDVPAGMMTDLVNQIVSMLTTVWSTSYSLASDALALVLSVPAMSVDLYAFLAAKAQAMPDMVQSVARGDAATLANMASFAANMASIVFCVYASLTALNLALGVGVACKDYISSYMELPKAVPILNTKLPAPIMTVRNFIQKEFLDRIRRVQLSGWIVPLEGQAGKPSLSAALSVLASATAVCVLLGCAPAIHALIQKGADKKAAEDLAYTLGMAVGLLYLVKKVN